MNYFTRDRLRRANLRCLKVAVARNLGEREVDSRSLLTFYLLVHVAGPLNCFPRTRINPSRDR